MVKSMRSKLLELRVRVGSLAFLLLLLAACDEPVYHSLSELEANEMVVVLEQHGLKAHKAVDPGDDQAWMVSVAAAERVRAWQILQDEGLPRPDVSGFGEHYPSGGLVPTSGEERIILQYSTAQELRKTLLAVDSVVDAQVNLVLPEKPTLRLEATVLEPPRASVLVKYHPAEEQAPLSEDAVRALVAGGVEGLDIEHVQVVFTRSIRSARPLKASELSAVGPLSVANESKFKFQLLILGMGSSILLLCAALTYLVFRQRREAERAPSSAEGAG